MPSRPHHHPMQWTSRTAIVLVLLLFLPHVSHAEFENRLADSASPYLQLHADDPVHWQPWDEETLALAAELDRPLYISSGFYACHWCHVMQRESFSDPAIARRLNRDFVPVKLDREVDLATDERLFAFLRATEGMAGWPLNVFATPEGRPYRGFLYQPRDAFADQLRSMAARWSEDAEGVRATAREHDRAAAEAPEPQPAGTAELRATLIRAALAEGDDFEGGFGDQTKFPRPPLVSALLPLAGENPQLEELVALTLEAIAGGGLHDHIGGGFFRYTEDPHWAEPHFEKMLYDNAQLAALYLRAGALREEPRWKAVGHRTLDFLLRAMARDDGGFISALSAEDAEGVEGGPYLWSPARLGGALDSEQVPVAARHFGLDRPPRFNAGHLPVPRRDAATVAAELERPVEDVERLLTSIYESLLATRNEREVPSDDKAVTAWNGLALSALALAADTERYREAGAALATFLRETPWRNGKLLRAVGPDGDPLGDAMLEDYAHAARGLLDWSEAVGDDAAATTAERLAETAWSRFHDDAGWHPEARPLLRYGGAVVLPRDGYLPAATAALHDVAARLGEADAGWAERAAALRKTIRTYAGTAPLEHAAHIHQLP